MKTSCRKNGVLGVIASLIVAATSLGAGVASADEYDTLRQKWKDDLTGGTTYDPNDAHIAAKITAITSSGQNQWNNMDKSPDRQFLWSDKSDFSTVSADLYTNYVRLKAMALAYATTGSALQNNPTLAADIVSALDWLYSTDKYSPNTAPYDNWWHWEIGSPKQLGDIMVLMYGQLSAAQIANYISAIDYFIPDPTQNGLRTGILRTSVGANRVDDCQAVAIRGVVGKNNVKIAAARDGLSPVFDYVTTSDGFYADGSFIQHVDVPYTFSYGDVLLEGIGKLQNLLTGSTWTVTDPDAGNVFKWVYDSYEPLLYKGAGMDMTRGRAISRPNLQDHAAGHSVVGSIAMLTQFASPADSAAFKSMVKYWLNADTSFNFYTGRDIRSIVLVKSIMNDGGVTERGELIKHKRYASMDRVVHLRPGFGFGLSMYSNRIQNYEDMNLENRRGWYTGDGMTYLYNNDLSAYSQDFWPTINPYRMPGTTVDTMARTDGSGEANSPNNWVGGTSLQDLYGVTGMDFKAWNSTLVAKKSWFMFDDEVVALGAGITNTNNRTIETIVENRKINGSGNNALTVNGTAKSTALGWTETMSAVNWAHLAGNVAGSDIGYYFPGAATVKGLRQARTEAWSAINSGASATPITRNYMTLWLDHGLNPSGQTYSYVLLPNKTSPQVATYAASPDITILENTAAAQAVKENTLNLTAVNFWNDATKTVGAITSNKKASVMTKVTGTQLEVTVADPTQANTGTVDIEINQPAVSVISQDAQISITQLSPTIRLSVNVNGAKGSTFKAKFNTP